MKKDLNQRTSQNFLTSRDTQPWSIENSLSLYQIPQWGLGYFTINDKGHLAVTPSKSGPNAPMIDFTEVLEEIQAQNISFPVVVRFQDILRDRVRELNLSFNRVIEEAGYKGKYRGVYPIKVNQLREVVEEIVDAGAEFNFGLEAGSKGEILAVLAMNKNPDSLTIVNGYKDEDFIKLAFLGTKLKRKMILVVEKLSELKLIISLAKKLDVEPMIGLRGKLSAKGSGKWANSGGERAKFGLTIPEIIKAQEMAESEGVAHWIKLFHFHIGSQITDIFKIKEALTEGARIYAGLRKRGLDVEYFDVGGGLAIDYEGSQTEIESSMNYSHDEYVRDVVYTLKDICDMEEVPHPHIVSESGRAISAHHSCFIMNVFGGAEEPHLTDLPKAKAKEHHLVKNMREIYQDLSAENFSEVYNDAIQKKSEALQAFNLGVLSLEERAIAETLFWKICNKLYDVGSNTKVPEDKFQEIEKMLVGQYYCNFSVFQSAIDSWAIGQLLPVVPLTRHLERPQFRATLSDITCDSDGKIDCFIGPESSSGWLPLHRINPGEQYYLGLFLTGAYQDIMGDNHNMFGRVNEVHIYVDDEDPTDFYIEEVIRGSKCQDILKTMQYNPEIMAGKIKRKIDQAVSSGQMRPREGVSWCDFYEDCLDRYTYLDTKN